MNQWYQRFSPRLSKNWMVAGPLIVGAVASYTVTASYSTNCKNMWLSMEERHSVITPAEGNVFCYRFVNCHLNIY